MVKTRFSANRRILVLGVLILMNTYEPSAAELRLITFDRATGGEVPARVRIRDATGDDHCPEGSVKVKIGKLDQWFVTAGQSTVRVPAGALDIRVERGLEYRPVKEKVRVKDGETVERTIRLERWIDMRARGYACGENHVHTDFPSLGPMLAAEDMTFGSCLQWWNSRLAYPAEPEKGWLRELEFGGVTVPTAMWDYENEQHWGALYVIGQREPQTAGKDRDRPNLALARASREKGALICYQGGWSREVLLDALLGLVDVVNVCNNNFHRHRFQPRSRYSNLLEVEGFPVYPPTAKGMMQLNTDTYYRLLNCGLRLAAGAGSAGNYKETPIGYNRAYVRVDGDPTLPEFLEAWRAGKNFVTNGPMLFLSVDDEHRPGDVIELGSAGRDLTIRVEAEFDYPLTGIEIIINGEVIARSAPGSEAAGLTHRQEVAEGAWIAARCTADDMLLSDEELAAYDLGDYAQATRLRFAHTSPVYVTVDGKGARVERSVEEAGKMLDALEQFAAERVGDEFREEFEAAMKTARERLGS